ncbi:MAG: TldD/PmbA family protein [Methanothrix sp.]|nr:TldD/PmbA family protein [Methanothrix sp.]
MRISDTSASLMECAHRLLAQAKHEGADEAEVFGAIGRSVDVDLRKSTVELASESIHRGLGVRAVVNGAVGFSSTSDMKLLGYVACSAVKSARARGHDDSWQSLPLPEKGAAPDGIYDARLQSIEPEDCLDLAMGMLRGCAAVQGAEPVSGGVTCVFGEEFVVNSHGIELHETSTLMHASIEAIARAKGIATGGEFQNSRVFQSDLENVGRAAAEMALASLGGEKLESGTFDVLLRPLAFVELLESTLLPSFSADRVQKGRSALAGREGKMIAEPGLQIVDSGLLSGGMASSAFDGEGVPSQETVLIKDGVLRGFLYDSYAAGKSKVKSTGNAVRSGYSDVPRVGIRNLIISSPGAFNLQEETRGLLVGGLIGAHTANPISGDFSVEAKNSFLIAPNESPRPIHSLMLAGNIFELLKDIQIGNDHRAVGSVVTPTVKVRMKAVGS